MSKIILAYEKGNFKDNTGWAYNGRIEPSTIAATQEELDSMDQFLREQYYMTIEPSKVEYKPWYIMWPYVRPHVRDQEFERKLVADIPQGEKYIYPINIGSLYVYVKYSSHIAISNRVLEDARKGLAHIVISYIYEGDLFKYKYKMKDLISNLNVPKTNIHFIQGDYNLDNYKDLPLTYHPVNIFPWWLRHLDSEIPEEKFNSTKLFNCYNRNLRPHRTLIIGLLHRANLLENSIYSFGANNGNELDFNGLAYQNTTTGNELSQDELKYLYRIRGTTPDGKKLSTENPAQDLNLIHYQHTFLSLVNETMTGEYMFFTEKTYKPIIAKHPFILFSGTNQLAKLKEFGFKTFDKWWDESYDSEPEVVIKAKKIVDVLSKLNTLSLDQRKEIRKEMLPILEHNRKVVLDIINEDQHHYHDWYPVKKIMEKLLNS